MPHTDLDPATIRRPWLARRSLGVLAMVLACAACDTTETLDLVGTVERKTLEMATPVSEVIVDIPVQIGSTVQAGQVLVRMDSEVAQAELEASRAALAAANATLTAAEQEYTRYQDLRRANVAAARQLDEARRDRDEALASVAERRARIAQARKRLNDLTIRAYAGGVVDQLPFEVGERVPGGGVVAVLLASEKPYVRVWVPARVVANLRRGNPAVIEVEGLGRKLEGTVTEVAREAEFTPHYALTERESAHLVYETRIAIDDAPAELRPGLPARVELEVDMAAAPAPSPAPSREQPAPTPAPATPAEEPAS